MTARLHSTALTLFALLICATSMYGQGSLPIGPTNAGTDFWVSFPANWEYAAGQKYIRLYITSGVRTKVDVWTGEDLHKTVYTVPFDVVTVDIPNSLAQVFVRNDAAPVPDDSVYVGRAVHVQAEEPVVVYGMNRTTATSDGMLLLPVNALGQEYIIASARDISDGTRQKLPSQYMIIAPYDSTHITIINSHGTPNHQEGEEVRITMNRGDVYSAMSLGQNGDLSGSYISADRPVAVTAGQNCTYLPDQRYGYCDHLCEMMMSVSSWGSTYHSVPYANRTKGDMYRVFAGEDDAKIYINGSLYATLSSKGGPEGVGWLEYLPTERQLIEFTSDKTIMVAQYNNSQTYDNSTGTDPFVSVLVPVDQYQSQIVFTTPSADFPQNYINLVCDSAAYFGIEIAPGGTDNWEKLSKLKGDDYKKFRSKINGLTYVGKTFDIDPGTYRMRGPRPFGAIIYGFSLYDSYGYPLAATVMNLGVDDDSASNVALRLDDPCGQQVTGTVNDLPDASARRANLSIVALDAELSSNYRLDVDPFITSIDRAATFRLNVIDPSKPAVGVIVAVDMAGNVTRDTVSYGGVAVQSDKSSLDYGRVVQPTSGEQQQVKLTNQSSASVQVTALNLQKGEQGFTIIQSPTLPMELAAGASIDVTIEFNPQGDGVYADSLGIVTSCGTKWLVELKGELITLGVDAPTPVISRLSLSPNPATGAATLAFSLDRRSPVRVTLHSIDGRLLRTLADRSSVEAGEQAIRFDVDDLPPGVYPLQVMVGDVMVEAPPVVVK